jgi:hypothetical protein
MELTHGAQYLGRPGLALGPGECGGRRRCDRAERWAATIVLAGRGAGTKRLAMFTAHVEASAPR